MAGWLKFKISLGSEKAKDSWQGSSRKVLVQQGQGKKMMALTTALSDFELLLSSLGEYELNTLLEVKKNPHMCKSLLY
jgi:hypothetical protein